MLGDLVVDRVHFLDHLRRFRHQLHVLPAPLGNPAVLSLDRLPQPAKDVVPGTDGAEEVVDGAHHGLDGLVVAHVTERDELLTSLACGPTRHARVGAGWRCACRHCDGETECGGEGLSRRGLNERSFGRAATERVTSDSTKATSMSGKPRGRATQRQS